ncbi:hypothetical protein DL770_008097 [Monosporascus sp. CRB-9-2]|nr:hypothetical protein DL770_008097 [Monosporascus sp. CRB-9-2]
MELIDVAIIGGRPAGLTAASTLVRQLHTTVVFDSKTYRNAAATHMHMVPTLSHRNPKEFRTEAKHDVESRYSSIRFADVVVTKVEKKNDSHFEVHDSDGTVWGFAKVILAVGCSDTHPDIEGYDQLYEHAKENDTDFIVSSVMATKIEAAGLLVSFAAPPISMSALVIHMAENAAQLSDEVTIYTHGNEELTAQLKPLVRSTFKVENRPIKRLLGIEGGARVKVEFTDGTCKEEKFLVHNPADQC